mgnify:CR=1 FL=1
MRALLSFDKELRTKFTSKDFKHNIYPFATHILAVARFVRLRNLFFLYFLNFEVKEKPKFNILNNILLYVMNDLLCVKI